MARNPTKPDQTGRDLRCAPAQGAVVNKCCGRDLGPLTDDEGPSEADIQRFGDVTRRCPECATEVYDDTEICWNCGHAFSSATAGSGRPPVWIMITVGLVIVGLAMLFIL